MSCCKNKGILTENIPAFSGVFNFKAATGFNFLEFAVFCWVCIIDWIVGDLITGVIVVQSGEEIVYTFSGVRAATGLWGINLPSFPVLGCPMIPLIPQALTDAEPQAGGLDDMRDFAVPTYQVSSQSMYTTLGCLWTSRYRVTFGRHHCTSHCSFFMPPSGLSSGGDIDPLHTRGPWETAQVGCLHPPG